MIKTYRKGAVGALLDIYQHAIADLQDLIKDITDDQLSLIIDTQTTDENCRSVQTILSHVVHSGFGYATGIHNLKGHNISRPAKIFHNTVKAYVQDLDKVFAFTEQVLTAFTDAELEQLNNNEKIKTNWGQVYDAEQLMEHAIVHILRHKRQIERIQQEQFS